MDAKQKERARLILDLALDNESLETFCDDHFDVSLLEIEELFGQNIFFLNTREKMALGRQLELFA